jgi:hypothetical protein
MREVVGILKSMGPEQLLLALVYLASYALALGEFATVRARVSALAAGLAAAAAFAVLSTPWEAGVVLVGFATVGMGLFSAAVWATWRATAPLDSPLVAFAAPVRPVARIVPLTVPAALVGSPAAALEAQPLAAKLPSTWATSSARPVNSAPILNSPGAE